MIEFKKQQNHKVPTQLNITQALRERIKTGNAIRLSPEEHDELAKHYQAVTNHPYSGYTCSDCIKSVYKTMNNWMTHCEARKPKHAARNTKVTEVQELPDMKLSQMREKWPSVRATSRETFWKKVVEGGLNA